MYGDFLKETQSAAEWLTSLRGARTKVRNDTLKSTVGISNRGLEESFDALADTLIAHDECLTAICVTES